MHLSLSLPRTACRDPSARLQSAETLQPLGEIFNMPKSFEPDQSSSTYELNKGLEYLDDELGVEFFHHQTVMQILALEVHAKDPPKSRDCTHKDCNHCSGQNRQQSSQVVAQAQKTPSYIVDKMKAGDPAVLQAYVNIPTNASAFVIRAKLL